MNPTVEIPMRAMPWLALLLLAMAACGSDAPAPPPAQPPKVSGPLKEPDPVDESVKLDAQQRTDAQRAIEAAKTAEEAQAGRDSYTGTKHATSLDVALERKLQQLDFTDFNTAKAAVLKTTAPKESIAASNQYTGQRYRGDLDKITWDHMEALVKKNPALASELPVRPVIGGSTVDVGKTLESLSKALDSAVTESQAEAMRAKFGGDFPPEAIEAVMERWRFGKATWRELVTLKSPNRATYARMLRTGGYIETWPCDGTLQRYDTDGNSTLTIGSNAQKILRAAVSPDCRSLITLTDRGMAQVRDLLTGEAGPEFWILKEPGSRILALSNGAETAAISSSGRNIRVWATNPGTHLLECENPKGPHVGGLDFSASGKYLLAAVRGGAKLFDTATGKELKVFGAEKDEFPFVALSPDEETVAVFSFVGKKVWLYKVQTGEAIRSIPLVNVPDGPPPRCFVSWLPSGRNLVVSVANYEVTFYNTETGESLASYSQPKGLLADSLATGGRKVVGSVPVAEGISVQSLGRPD